MQRETISGTALVTIGAVMISFAAVFVKLAHVGPTTAAFYRMAIAGCILAVPVIAGRHRAWSGSRAVLVAGVAGVLFALDLVVWHRSIHFVGPGLATILANFQVFILAGFGIIVLRERVSWRLAVAIPMALAGLFLLVGVDWSIVSRSYRVGVIFGLVTAVVYGSLLLVLRWSRSIEPRLDLVPNLMVVCLVAAVLLVPVAFAQGEGLGIPDSETVALLVGYALTAQVVGWLFITRGLPRVQAGRAGLLLLLQPSLAFIWDIVLFRRPTSGLDVAGAVLALGAIYLGTAPRAR